MRVVIPWVADSKVALAARHLSYVSTRFRGELGVSGDVIPMILEVGLAREDARELDGDHVEGFGVLRPESTVTCIVHDRLKML